MEAQVQTELVEIVANLSKITGLSSRWKGQVELVPDAKYKGMKSFSCVIKIQTGLATEDVRWRTYIHEALHSLSMGLTQPDYQQFRGWEEGVVEQSQRLLRQRVLQALNVGIEEDVFVQDEAKHRFNIYIAALEQLRHAVGEEDEPKFYLWLLSIPLRERRTAILKRGYDLPFDERVAFVRTFSATNFVLTQEVR